MEKKITAAKVRTVFRNYVKSQPLWNGTTIDLSLTDKEIEDRVSKALEQMKFTEVDPNDDNFISTMLKMVFVGEVLSAMNIDKNYWKPYRMRLRKASILFGVPVAKDELSRFRKAINDCAKEVEKEKEKEKEKSKGPPEVKNLSLDDVYKAYAVETLYRRSIDPPSFYELELYGNCIVASAVNKLSITDLPKLEQLVSQTLLEARTSLVLPKELVSNILAGAERAFNASYASKGTVIVQRDEEDNREEIDKAVMKFVKKNDPLGDVKRI